MKARVRSLSATVNLICQVDDFAMDWDMGATYRVWVAVWSGSKEPEKAIYTDAGNGVLKVRRRAANSAAPQ